MAVRFRGRIDTAAARRAVHAQLPGAVGAGLDVLLDESNERVPVETGHLRSSGHVDVDGKEGSVSYSAEYGVYVHEVSPTTGGRWDTGYTHAPGTGWKFLEDATHTAPDRMLRAMAREIQL